MISKSKSHKKVCHKTKIYIWNLFKGKSTCPKVNKLEKEIKPLRKNKFDNV